MTGQPFAFWAKYRGPVDPQRNDFMTAYNYQAIFTGPNGLALQTISFGVLGPPQLTKERYIELRWNTPPGLMKIHINKNSPTAITNYYQYNGAEGGTRDEGRYNILGTGVLQQ